MAAPFPPIIADLPEVDIPIEGAQGWLLQGESRQAVFLNLAPGVVVPDHTHGAQWGIVIDGQIELTVAGESAVRFKGDSYHIPAGTPHSARCPAGALILELFADPDRYAPRP